MKMKQQQNEKNEFLYDCSHVAEQDYSVRFVRFVDFVELNLLLPFERSIGLKAR